MHELSLAEGILRVLEQTRERDPFERITQLRLEVGALAGVEIESLRFALNCIAANTLLAGASIEINQPPGDAWCLPCAQSVEITSRLDACPICGGYQLQATGGTELRVVDMQVE
jgi:hydrogenase nickel incorporation protein HypA/HybF